MGLLSLKTRASGAQLGEIAKLIDSGVLRPIIDRTYPFAEAPRALAHVEGGRAKGKVVITAGDDERRIGVTPS